MAAPELKTVVDAYVTHAGYRQLASPEDLPVDVRRVALTAMADAHERGLATLRMCAFTSAEARAVSATRTTDAAPSRPSQS